MIVRRWRGRLPADRADEYLDYVRGTGLRDYAATPGHIRTLVLRRTLNGIAELELLTIWESLDAIRAFTGGDIEHARYYPDDAYYLLDLPPSVEHWELVDEDPR